MAQSGEPVVEYSPTAVQAVNCWSPNGLLTQTTPSNTSNPTIFYAFDPSGNTAEQLNTNGTLNDSMFVTEFGGMAAATVNGGPGYPNFNEYSMFASQWGGAWQGNTGLVLLGDRFYDESYGRFLTRDPAGMNGGFNLYRYCGNDPTGSVDPSGLGSAGQYTTFGGYLGEVGQVFEGEGEGLGNFAVDAAVCSVTSSPIVQVATALDPQLADPLNGLMNPFGSGCGEDQQFGQITGQILGTVGMLAAPEADCVFGCFVAGTPVQMADGTTKPIQDIKVGDLVKTRSIATGITESKPVLQLYRPLSASLVTLHLATGDCVTCTPEHPFYVAGQGFVPAGRLAIGNAIVTRAGPTATVTSISWQHETSSAPFQVYNFEVEGDHTYFVGKADGGAWVHNACGSAMDQIFADPEQLAGKSLADVQGMIGDIEDPWVEGTLSRGSQMGNGWTMRESTPDGNWTDRYLQWHPGGGYHGPDPYWKISSGSIGTLRFPAL